MAALFLCSLAFEWGTANAYYEGGPAPTFYDWLVSNTVVFEGKVTARETTGRWVRITVTEELLGFAPSRSVELVCGDRNWKGIGNHPSLADRVLVGSMGRSDGGRLRGELAIIDSDDSVVLPRSYFARLYRKEMRLEPQFSSYEELRSALRLARSKHALSGLDGKRALVLMRMVDHVPDNDYGRQAKWLVDSARVLVGQLDFAVTSVRFTDLQSGTSRPRKGQWLVVPVPMGAVGPDLELDLLSTAPFEVKSGRCPAFQVGIDSLGTLVQATPTGLRLRR
ncbi:MAG: hypothetical protein HOP12_11160 [Candidatus Eisenbacteria bacterium]|uniref:Uncharacterized protein n=1 Tax=Eiseniibacteriota bacterium TaxID=2212470 RepID=A0A849SLS5_UNCEI|nr:hypothetical protein [Candidatus Eisenbacteria bacterium]